jgi:hypothetical protein
MLAQLQYGAVTNDADFWSVDIIGVDKGGHAAHRAVRVRRLVEPVVDEMVSKISVTGFASPPKPLTAHKSLSI